ncbi:MAG: GNAT family N-acetyltransferase [Thermomicrobiales bacterium]
MQRVRAIIIESRSIALMERHRENRRYLVFPGGGMEAGETPHEALNREVLEETGLLIDVGPEVATVSFPDHVQRFYLVSVIGGEFGAGTGPEYSDPARTNRGTYQPVWLPLADIGQEPVYPKAVATLVVDAQEAGWPERPIRFTDASSSVTSSIQVVMYRVTDWEGCMHVFDSNTPTFFAPHERATFVTFLTTLPGPFWVARDVRSRAVIGCGGVSLTDEGRTAWLRWGMVHAARHNEGIGTQLLQTRLEWIHRQPTIMRVRIATTEQVRGFFERMGFAVVAVSVDGFGRGASRYDLELTVGAGLPT